MSPIRSRRRAGRRTEKSPSRAELSDARLVVDLVEVVLAAGFFFAGGFRVVDFAVAPVLAGLLLPPLVRGWATAPLLLRESQRSSERYSSCKAGGRGLAGR